MPLQPLRPIAVDDNIISVYTLHSFNLDIENSILKVHWSEGYMKDNKYTIYKEYIDTLRGKEVKTIFNIAEYPVFKVLMDAGRVNESYMKR
jgi:hypothetical protein